MMLGLVRYRTCSLGFPAIVANLNVTAGTKGVGPV